MTFLLKKVNFCNKHKYEKLKKKLITCTFRLFYESRNPTRISFIITTRELKVQTGRGFPKTPHPNIVYRICCQTRSFTLLRAADLQVSMCVLYLLHSNPRELNLTRSNLKKREKRDVVNSRVIDYFNQCTQSRQNLIRQGNTSLNLTISNLLGFYKRLEKSRIQLSCGDYIYLS